jgi:hypothetical protein
MKRLYTPLGVVLLTLLLASGARAQNAGTKSASQLDNARTALAREATTFIENKGQWNPQARFLARTKGLDLWVTDEGLTYDLYRMTGGNGASASGKRVGHVVRMVFDGAGSSASAQGLGQLPGTVNYYNGSDRSKWAVGVPRFSEARINHLYNGVDAALYFENGHPRYDLLLAPGADASSIRISYDGATSLTVARSGELAIGTSLGVVKQQGLFAYQMVDGRKKQVSCSFTKLDAEHVGFALGSYDRSKMVVIDPVLYSSYIGGTGTDEPRAIAADGTNKLYITGYTLSANFPTITGSYSLTYGGDISGTPPGGDVFVAKLDVTQTPANQLIYATYIGSSNDEVGSDIAVDVFGSAYITGTATNLYPTTNQVAAILGTGIFVTKLSSSGGTLAYSTFVADSAFSIEGGIAVTPVGEATVTGSTTSSVFAAFVNSYQSAIGGGADAFVARLNPSGSGLIYATFLGGSGDDIGTDIALSGNAIFVAGSTTSGNFPMLPVSAYDSSYNGNTDAFVSRLEPAVLTGTAQLTYSTSLGGSDYDAASALGIDDLGNISVAGSTLSNNFPVVNAVQAAFGGGADGDAFVTKINPFAARASQLMFSTYLGGANGDAVNDLTVDASRNTFVTGWTASPTFPVTANAIRKTFSSGDSADVFVAKLGDNGSLRYSTYLGGSAGDRGNGIVLTANNDINLTGYTWSQNYPTSPNAMQATKSGGSGGGADGFVTRIAILEILVPVGGESFCAGTVQNVTWSGGTSTNYDIMISSNAGATYNPLSLNVVGNNFAWPIPASFPAGTRYRLKIIATNSNGTESDVSDSNFTINTPPTVTLQPNNVTQPQGGTASFTAIASGTPAPTVHWEVNTGNGTWTAIPNATSTTLNITGVGPTMNGNQYRAVFTNGCATVPSNPATLTVSSVHVVSPNGGEEWCAGTVQRIVWTAGENGGPYDVAVSKDGGQSWLTLATTISDTSYAWSIPGTFVGTQFLAQVRTSNGQTSDISDHNFTINNAARVSQQPASATGVIGNNANFTSLATGQPQPTVQWEMNTGSGWTPVTGATNPNLQVAVTSASQNGTRYRAVYSNSCGSDTTREATLTVATTGVNEPTTGLGALRVSVAPNPITSSGEIHVSLPRAGEVQIDIADINGNVISHLTNGTMSEGDHVVNFNTAGLPSGAYMVILSTNGERRMVKVTVAK